MYLTVLYNKPTKYLFAHLVIEVNKNMQNVFFLCKLDYLNKSGGTDYLFYLKVIHFFSERKINDYDC